MSRRFDRNKPRKQPRRLIMIVPEGKKTEPEYFETIKKLFKDQLGNITVKCDCGQTGNDPDRLLNRVKKIRRDQAIQNGVEYWIVFDRDQWQEKRFENVRNWSKNNSNCYFAISNPSFEYWLLLHFSEKSYSNLSQKNCLRKLNEFWPDYDKGIRNLTCNHVSNAIKTAKKFFNSRDAIFSETGTNVFELVEKIIGGQ